MSFGNRAPQNSTMIQEPQNATDEMNAGTSQADLEIDKIQSFVFFDLETSGFGGMDCRILELSMVAVSREDLLNMKKSVQISFDNRLSNSKGHSVNSSPVPKLPRVLHKYSKLYYPRKIILPVVEEVTGLSNELLHRLPGFSSASAEALNLFLDLPKPIALVAHNGNRFDYPLLKAELQNVLEDICSLKSFRELLCADTLIAFREIDANQKLEQELQEVKEISEITSLAASFSFEDMDGEDDDFMDLEPESKKVRFEENGKEDSSRRDSTPPSPVDGDPLEISADLAVTPVKDHCIIVNQPKTPTKAKIPPKAPVTPETSTLISKVKGDSNVRRSLTYGGKKRKWDGTMPYKQVNVYNRLFGSHYDAHRAEADCIALLEICGFYSKHFVEWADSNFKPFNSVKPMWGRRKSFKIS